MTASRHRAYATPTRDPRRVCSKTIQTAALCGDRRDEDGTCETASPAGATLPIAIGRPA
jgi:hypothetical protein